MMITAVHIVLVHYCGQQLRLRTITGLGSTCKCIYGRVGYASDTIIE